MSAGARHILERRVQEIERTIQSPATTNGAEIIHVKNTAQFMSDESGQGLAEYGIMLAILVGLVILVTGPFKNAIFGLFNKTDSTIESADVNSGTGTFVGPASLWAT
jgi:Flp pilus assembly pilin Flp